MSRCVEPHGVGKSVILYPDPVLHMQAWLYSLYSPESCTVTVARDTSTSSTFNGGRT